MSNSSAEVEPAWLWQQPTCGANGRCRRRRYADAMTMVDDQEVITSADRTRQKSRRAAAISGCRRGRHLLVNTR